MKSLQPKDWLNRRVREFPLLYRDYYEVISACIIGEMGGCYWTDDGNIDYDPNYVKNGNGKRRHPAVLSKKVAANFGRSHFQGFIKILHGTTGIINKIPDNANVEWLKILRNFLTQFNFYTDEVIRSIVNVQSFIRYGDLRGTEEHQFKYQDFLKKRPEWLERINSILKLTENDE